MRYRNGFTLIELLVVIGIIGILIAALVPAVKNASTRAKEAQVKAQAGNIEAALSAYAQNHNGNYPGVAVDVMAPYADHALGDSLSSPPLYTRGGINAYDASPGRMVNGVLGGFGHYNNVATNVFEQLRTAKNTAIMGGENTARYFDSLIASDAIQEYPPNPFATGATGERQRMRNIFTFQIDVAGGFDPTNLFSPGVSDPNNAGYNVALYVTNGGQGGVTTPDSQDTTRLFLQQNPLPMGINVSNYLGETFAAQSVFGTDETDYFAPGDFAYIPVLSTSPYAFGDSTATVENEAFKWGTVVSGYMLFAYGHQTHKNREFDDSAREFAATGLPGYGNAGVDTIYEHYALQCFEGAVYFSKKY